MRSSDRSVAYLMSWSSCNLDQFRAVLQKHVEIIDAHMVLGQVNPILPPLATVLSLCWTRDAAPF